MTSQILRHLGADEFSDAIGFVLPPVPMRHVLQLSLPVRMLESALRYGQVTSADVGEFVSNLLMDFRPGEVFRHDIALAALAVAMEHWHSAFAEEYLLDLARLQRTEFRCSFRVARECLNARYVFPRTQVKTTRYPQAVIDRSLTPRGISLTPRGIRIISAAQLPACEGKVTWVRYPKVAHAST
jgi:hypothetical protein